MDLKMKRGGAALLALLALTLGGAAPADAQSSSSHHTHVCGAREPIAATAFRRRLYASRKPGTLASRKVASTCAGSRFCNFAWVSCTL